MKQSPQLGKAEEAMKPGVITKEGFLGTDVRHLVEILTEDDAEVARFVITSYSIHYTKLYDRGCRGRASPAQ